MVRHDAEWNEYWRKRLGEAEKELADFENCLSKYGLRVLHRDVNGERDITDQSRRDMQSTIDEYRSMLRDD
jgi:hypothetical protein